MSQDELEDVLEELYSAGNFDSSGSFRVRADKAREKLAQFRLQNRHAYICHLYSFGFMAGASRFTYSVGLRTTVLKFEGMEVELGMLEDIFSYLMISPQSAMEWAVHELALGLHSGQAAGVKRVVIDSGRWTVTVEGEQIRSRRDATDEPGFALVLHHRRTLGAILGGLLFRKESPEIAVLKEAVTPELWLDKIEPGRWIRRREDSPDPPESAVMGFHTGCGFVALGHSGSESGDSVVLSIRGRRFPFSMKFGKGKVSAFHVDDTLTLDLSQSFPVYNDRFLQVRRILMDGVAEARTKLLFEKPECLDSRDRRTLVRQVSRSQRTRAELSEARAVLEIVRFNESRIAALSAMRGEFREAAELLRSQLEQAGFPDGLKPGRYLDLATVEASLGEKSAFQTWQRGYELMQAQHSERKGHLVSEALESKLLWSFELGQDFEAAWADWELARDLKKHLGPGHPRTAETLERGAYLKWLAGRPDESLDLAVQALAIRVEHLGEGNPAGGQALALKALAERSSGDEMAARRTASKRLALMLAVYGPDHPESAASHHLQAWTEGQGKSERATEILAAKGVYEPPLRRLVCFRGWFHSRSPWCCCYPLAIDAS